MSINKCTHLNPVHNTTQFNLVDLYLKIYFYLCENQYKL